MQRNFHAYEEVQALPPADRDILFRILYDAQAGDQQVLQALQTLVYDELPVDMEEFLLGRRYLGLKGLVNPEKIELMIEFDRPYVRHAFCAIGSGAGKSFMVSCLKARQVYNLLCLKRPDLFYMLGPGSQIGCINLSVSKEQARDVIFTEFLGRLANSPWFRGKYKPLRTRAYFPKGVFAMSGGTSATSYYGYHPIMGTLDEASFMFDNTNKSIADELVEALTKSLHTRFPRAYKLFVVSTLRSTDDFVYGQLERIKDDGICIINRPTFAPTATAAVS